MLQGQMPSRAPTGSPWHGAVDGCREPLGPRPDAAIPVRCLGEQGRWPKKKSISKVIDALNIHKIN